MKWILIIYLGAATEPTVIVDSYESEAQCSIAADLIIAADIAARGSESDYSTVCQERMKS
jgi:hypothetical protein